MKSNFFEDTMSGPVRACTLTGQGGLYLTEGGTDASRLLQVDGGFAAITTT